VPGLLLPAAIAAAALWTIAPPYVSPLDVDDTVEVVDHVVPGLVSLAAALYVLARARAGDLASTPVLIALGICAVGGAWVTLTHVTLLADAGEPGRPVGSVLLHVTAGPLLLVPALWCLVRPR
jgi:hypothetical protein